MLLLKLSLNITQNNIVLSHLTDQGVVWIIEFTYIPAPLTSETGWFSAGLQCHFYIPQHSTYVLVSASACLLMMAEASFSMISCPPSSNSLMLRLLNKSSLHLSKFALFLNFGLQLHGSRSNVSEVSVSVT
mmetsp:Transcript_14023/g.20953  ORF Transcript_14023/g.20953 Transcript_14023/m.20953 type:complete len:131 (+) Transcript_14023:81-473(+)